MTPEERHLYYDYFKHLSVTVKRQYPIDYYIADFYIAKADLIVELDSSQHYEEEGKAWDAARDQFFCERGLEVLRFSNKDVYQYFEAICECISRKIEERMRMRLRYK